jgi:hypothetical protein
MNQIQEDVSRFYPPLSTVYNNDAANELFKAYTVAAIECMTTDRRNDVLSHIRGGEPIPSDEVLRQTQGLYNVVHLMVYCPHFTGEMLTIENTVLRLLMDLGWNPEDPRVGATVSFLGDPEFTKAMAYVIVKRRLPHSSYHLPRDPELAMEAMEYAFKQTTHAVEFSSRSSFFSPDAQRSVFSQMAWSHGVSYLKFALTT